MDFRTLYKCHSARTLKLECQWFHRGGEAGPPFLRRNLLYIRTAREGVERKVTSKADKEDESTTERKVTPKADKEDESKLERVDLLFQLFRHRTVLYNDALLESSRRATRRLTAASSKSQKKDGKASKESDSSNDNPKKRKHASMNETDDDDSSRDSFNLNPPVTDSPRSFSEQLDAVEKKHAAVKRRKTTKSKSRRKYVFLSQFTKAQARGFFHYLFIDETGCPATHTEILEDRRCPFCFHDAISDSGLVAHLEASHGDGVSFVAARTETGVLHVSVRVDTNPSIEGNVYAKDFVFVAGSSSALPDIPFVKRPIWKVAALDPAARKRKMRLLEEMGADEARVQSFVLDDQVPARQYYHSRTNELMLYGDWDLDSDDDSADDAWRHKMSAALLDDYEDVSSEEKVFMKLWNVFIKSHTVIADHEIPKKCLAFVREKIVDLHAQNLRQHMLLHVHNLWDHGLLSSDHVLNIMMEYDQLEWSVKGKAAKPATKWS